MKKELSFSNPLFRFVVLAGVCYVILYLVYQFVIKTYTFYDQRFIGHIIHVSAYILRLMGYKPFMTLQDIDLQVVGIDGSNGVWVGSNCNAITLFGLFAVFILAYPGRQTHKLWYLPLGIVLIHLLNIIRVVCLAVIAYYYPESLEFNHTYIFTFLVYAFILLLWLIWVNKFAGKIFIPHEKQA